MSQKPPRGPKGVFLFKRETQYLEPKEFFIDVADPDEKDLSDFLKEEVILEVARFVIEVLVRAVS
jgi:hypothetical protein